MKRIIHSVIILFCLFITNDTRSQEIPKWKLEDLRSAIDHADKPTIFNFWATFCKPCVAEIPYFQQLVKKYDSAGVRLVLVSLDLAEMYPQKIKTFANRYKFTAPITYLNETNADLFCPVVDTSWSGAIPASLFINNKTSYRKFFEKQLSREQLEKEIREMIREKHVAMSK